MIYWLLSVLTAAVAYGFGCLDSLVVSSNLVFRRNLRRLERNDAFISNFQRLYGWKGWLKLALVELALDLLPILIGGWLFGTKGQALVGRTLAAFCLLMGRMWPALYGLRGRNGLFALIVAAFCVDVSMGVAVLLVAVGAVALSRYLSLGSLVGAAVYAIIALLMLDDALATRLCLFTAAVILVRQLPAISRLVNRREKKLNLEEDITYKFDEKF